MKLRAKPQKPERKIIEEKTEIHYYSNLESLVQWATQYTLDLTKAQIESESWDEPNYYLSVKYKETDAQYDKRLLAYKKRLEQYDDWYNKNKEKIDAELNKSEGILDEKARREITLLEKKLDKLRVITKRTENGA